MPDSMTIRSTRQYRKLARLPLSLRRYLQVIHDREVGINVIGREEEMNVDTHQTRSDINNVTLTFVAKEKLKREPFHTWRICAKAL